MQFFKGTFSRVYVNGACCHSGAASCPNLAATTGKVGEKGKETQIPIHKEDHQQTMNSSGGHSTHNIGKDNDQPGCPFFWIHGKICGPEMLTVWNPFEEELKIFTQMLENSPSISSKDHAVRKDLQLKKPVFPITSAVKVRKIA